VAPEGRAALLDVHDVPDFVAPTSLPIRQAKPVDRDDSEKPTSTPSKFMDVLFDLDVTATLIRLLKLAISCILALGYL